MRFKRFTGRAAVAVFGGLVGYLLFWPIPIDPVAWTPPASPGFTGPYEENQDLADVQLLAAGVGKGPESITRGPGGYLYAGLRDGRIIRFSAADTLDVKVFANTRGSPGGLVFDSLGNLIVCDALKGLLSVAPDGGITVLVERLNGRRLLFLDGLAISTDGTIWFTEASQRWGEGEFGNPNYAYEFLENRPTGCGVSRPFPPGVSRAFPGDRLHGATRPCWSEGSRGCDDSMKCRTSSSGCETRPARGEPARVGSEPCDGRGNAAGEA